MSDQPAERTDVSHRAFLHFPSPCVLIDMTGRIQFANAAWSAAQGRTLPLAPAGGNLLTALAGVSAAAAEGLAEMLAGRRAEFSGDLCVDGSQGTWIRLLASRASADSAVVMLVDVTDHPAALARDEVNLRLERILEAAMDAIITVDESERVVIFNRAAEKVFGISAREAIGGPLNRFIPARVRPDHSRHVQEFGRTGVSSRGMGSLGTLTGLRADGTEFAMEASISHASAGGKRFFTVILRDVSERKRLEAQFLHAQKMEGVGRLAGGIAHDFNNLLMAIFNYLTLASRKVGEEHPARSAIAHAQQAAERAADLTRQLLTFARKQPLSPRVLDPGVLVQSLTPMLKGLIGEDVELRVLVDPGTANVTVDQSQLEQVIVNLGVNARDAMPGGGTLTVEVRNVVLDETYCAPRAEVSPGLYVEVAVTDSGVGMSPEVQSRLFEPFFTTKPPGKGTGLGLATSHGIIKQNGGHIAVYSELGKGTSVRVYLPRVRGGAQAMEEAPRRGTAPRGTERVLLVEDSVLVRDLVAEELRLAGYEVTAASNGVEALELYRKAAQPIELVVTDVVLPGMSGVELVNAIEAEGNEPPVIFMSGYTQETIALHGVDPGKRMFLAKPFMMDTLLHAMRRVLGARERSGR